MADLATSPLHGGQLRQISQRFGIPQLELLDFSANINPDGPPAGVLSALRASLCNPATLTEYPDLDQTDLRQSLAGYAGTHEKNVVVANGFVPLLEAALRALKPRSCLLPIPAFVEYRRTLDRAGVAIIPHPLTLESSFAYEDARLFSGQQDAMLLANPQNPSGVAQKFSSMLSLVERAADKGMAVLLDEAFIDYVPQHSLSTQIEHFPNLITFRSVTKFFGIAGLRVAYALAEPNVAAAMRENLAPWPVTTLAAHAVAAAVSDRAYAAKARSQNQIRSAALRADLDALGLAVYPSAGNFLLFRIPQNVDPSIFWQNLVVEHRIVVRDCANYESLGAGHFRAAIRTPDENRRLTLAFKKSLSGIP